ncbi:MAG: hypothetical protein KDD58_05975 [Bdellovibrionales bacterium]|nr:hypothetical protein [Bdellovibrionales bacterium]
MNHSLGEDEFEGTLILEKLAEIGKVDSFFEAIDSDDIDAVKSLMIQAGIEKEVRAWVLNKIKEMES